ncbi:flagellar motor switch phosphatase FliY [Lutibacter sp. B2]|nr:flagellar motor switch phosphatase FliY [Lutibacter sp. B2]
MADMLSQEEIDALLNGGSNNTPNNEEELTDDEKDALGEIGNISMGTSATTLFTLLGQKVTITTPEISILTMGELSEQYPIPFVAVEVSYKEGIKGTNVLVLREHDVKVITDLMMGGDGTNTDGELSELHLSAIGEAMNQMVGSSSTSLSEMFNSKIDICPPKAMSVNFSKSSDKLGDIDYNDRIVKIAFKMVVGDIIDSEIMQVIPIKFAKDMVTSLLNNTPMSYEEDHTDIQNKEIQQKTQLENENYNTQEYRKEERTRENMSRSRKEQEVQVQPVQFEAFDDSFSSHERENISLIRDVPLSITVELGSTSKKINEILSFAPGTVIELDKIVGEPLDILVNGQFMAKGEVVVIDENYGVRVTDIVNPTNKIR